MWLYLHNSCNYRPLLSSLEAIVAPFNYSGGFIKYKNCAKVFKVSDTCSLLENTATRSEVKTVSCMQSYDTVFERN